MNRTLRLVLLAAALVIFPLRGLAAIALSLCANEKSGEVAAQPHHGAPPSAPATDHDHASHGQDGPPPTEHGSLDCLALCGLCAAHCAGAFALSSLATSIAPAAGATEPIAFERSRKAEHVPLPPERPPLAFLR